MTPRSNFLRSPQARFFISFLKYHCAKFDACVQKWNAMNWVPKRSQYIFTVLYSIDSLSFYNCHPFWIFITFAWFPLNMNNHLLIHLIRMIFTGRIKSYGDFKYFGKKLKKLTFDPCLNGQLEFSRHSNCDFWLSATHIKLIPKYESPSKFLLRE